MEEQINSIPKQTDSSQHTTPTTIQLATEGTNASTGNENRTSNVY